MIYALIFIIFDIISGFLISLFTKSFSSSKMRKGLLNKIGEIMSILLMMVVEQAAHHIGIDSQIATHLVDLVCGYIIIMEFGSILENIRKMSPNMATFIDDVKEEIAHGKNNQGD